MVGFMKSRVDIVEEVRELLHSRLREHVEAAFVYGSVAAGAATPNSDIDTFVLAKGDVPRDLTSDLAMRYAQLQTRLGYQPDAEHPIEVFPLHACVDSLHDGFTMRALATAAGGGPFDSVTLTSDCFEILRALLSQRLVVIDSPALERLTRLAASRLDRAARRHGVNPAVLGARLCGSDRQRGP